MSLTRQVGTQAAIASAYGAAIIMSGVSNAAAAEATLSAAHGLVVGDYVQIKSGWSLLNDRVVRVSAVDGTDVTLEGVNTTDTNAYPAAAGAGSVRKITAWTPITQIKKEGGITASGGEPKYAPSSTIDDEDDKQIPDGRTAMSLSIVVFDDPAQPWYSVVKAASDAADQPVALRLAYKNGSKTFACGYWSMPDMPAQQAILENTITFAAAGRITRYAN